MERLTKRGHKFNLTNVMEGLNGYIEVDEILNRLAQYEDAEEQGLLVRLPRKVGDVLYEPYKDGIDSGRFTTSTLILRATSEVFEPSDIGKTVFLTREEAEAARKGAQHE